MDKTKDFISFNDRGDDVLLWLKDIEHIKIPEGIQFIDQQAFSGCNTVRSIEFPSTVLDIRVQYFGGVDTEHLEEFIVSEDNRNYKSVDGVLYTKNGYTLVAYPPAKEENTFTVPSSVRWIEEAAFCHCEKLKSIILPDSLEGIGEFAFGYCTALESITIPEGVKPLPDDVFEGCEALKIKDK